MSFTALFVALLLERFFDCSHLRSWGWYTSYQRLVMQKMPGQSNFLVLAVMVLPFMLAVPLVGFVLSDMLVGFVKLVFSISVLLYCFGPRNLWADMYACINALNEGDHEVGVTKLKLAFGITVTPDKQQTHRELLANFFKQSNLRIFAIIFWYGMLGLMGIVMYRLVSLTIPEIGKEGDQAKGWLDWPTVRVITFVFALGGHFNRVFSVWIPKAMLGSEVNDTLLTECGMAALAKGDMNEVAVDGSLEKEAVSLLDRSYAIVLVIIAVLVYLIP